MSSQEFKDTIAKAERIVFLVTVPVMTLTMAVLAYAVFGIWVTELKKILMKVGELGQLSAYGKKLKLLSQYAEDTGILISNNHVMFTSTPRRLVFVNRKDIKKARR